MTRRPSPRVFERLAEAYRARPGYPEALVQQLLTLAPLAARVVDLVQAPAESTGLPAVSAELVVLADAAQWVDPEAAGREAFRLLVPGGTAATVEPRPADTPFMRDLERLLRQANPERRPQAPGRGRQWLALASGGGPVRALEFHHTVELSAPALEAVLRSFSFLGPALGPTRMASLVTDAAELARRAGGARWERILRLAWAQKRLA